MYRAIVAARTRSVWHRINQRELDVPWRMAAPDLHFTFVGDTPLRAELHDRDEFRAWLESIFALFPTIKFTVADVAVAGWPWRTRVAVRLEISATLADGSDYSNVATQWLTLRWGRMTEDWVVEDAVALDRACRIQKLAA